MSISSSGTCNLCGSRLIFQYLQTPLGEVFCTSHGDLPSCRLCAAPYESLTDSTEYCAACRAGGVGDQAAVRRELPGIRADLSGMGIVLAQRVRVRLVSRPEIDRMGGREIGAVNGLTIHQGQSVLDLAVVAGLPAAKFGLTVAHEAMHAWMAQRGFAAMDPPVEEGLCELAAFRWLKGCSARGAGLLRDRIRLRKDAVYGDGFRAVHQAVSRHGLRRTLRVVAHTGRLPG